VGRHLRLRLRASGSLRACEEIWPRTFKARSTSARARGSEVAGMRRREAAATKSRAAGTLCSGRLRGHETRHVRFPRVERGARLVQRAFARGPPPERSSRQTWSPSAFADGRARRRARPSSPALGAGLWAHARLGRHRASHGAFICSGRLRAHGVRSQSVSPR
jgi:hypothetical protein